VRSIEEEVFMKGFVVFLVLLVGVLSSAPSAFAVPASPDVVSVTQPSGAAVKVVLKGDEGNNWVETTDGYTISKGADDVWYYVVGHDGSTPILNGVRAGEPVPAGMQQHLQPVLTGAEQTAAEALRSLQAGPVGTFSGKILFILARFTDRAPTYTPAQFASFINTRINKYYNTASYGKVTLAPAAESFGTANDGVVGWVNLGYAHPNTGSSTGLANQTLTKKAILKANPYVNFAAFDTNGDGYVDSSELAVVVIVAGYERSYSATYTPSVWGHKWSLDGVGAPTVDGKIVGADHGGAGGYAQFGEIHQSSSTDKHMASVGIMVHELGHLIFGLPDLYDTDYSSSGVGAFCIMSGGSWGKSNAAAYAGQTPVLPSAWIKYNRQWVDGTPVGDVSASIVAAGATTATSANTVFRKMTGVTGEYFLTENRKDVGYDMGLERYLGAGFGGVAIWHVDENVATNSNDAHRKVDLEEADGTQMGTGPGAATDLWYVGNKTSFTGATTPNTKTYDGKPTCIAITTKSAKLTTMTVAFKETPGCCDAQTCGTFTSDCDPSVAPCYCFERAVGGKGKCVDNYYCSSTTSCATDADCKTGWACYVNTCCGSGGTCGPGTCTGVIQGPSLVTPDTSAACIAK
jgi:M6 family metalloprotease-like protein